MPNPRIPQLLQVVQTLVHLNQVSEAVLIIQTHLLISLTKVLDCI